MSIQKLRKKIDAIDARIVSLLNDRAEVSAAIGKEKVKKNQEFYSPHREKEVFDRVKTFNKGKIPPDALQAIYREIMSCSLALEKPLSIAALGQKGSYTNIAARKIFGSQVEYISFQYICDICQKVESTECDYGVMPIENST